MTRFEWLKSKVNWADDECLIWPFGRHSAGYGSIRIKAETLPAHRAMCILAHGDPPIGKKFACHSCGNRNCVNPKHLRWDTPSQNMLDRVLHGTDSRGEKSWNSKLNKIDVHFIRNSKMKNSDLAKHFGVAHQTISDIKGRRNWKWLEASDNAPDNRSKDVST